MMSRKSSSSSRLLSIESIRGKSDESSTEGAAEGIDS